MTDKQIRDRIAGALSVSMMPMEMEAECVAFLDRCLADHLLVNGVRLETKQVTSEKNKRWIPMTNADRIRAMNNYELAVFLSKVKALVYRADLSVIAYSTQDMAENLDWLQQPVKEGT